MTRQLCPMRALPPAVVSSNSFVALQQHRTDTLLICARVSCSPAIPSLATAIPSLATAILSTATAIPSSATAIPSSATAIPSSATANANNSGAVTDCCRRELSFWINWSTGITCVHCYPLDADRQRLRATDMTYLIGGNVVAHAVDDVCWLGTDILRTQTCMYRLFVFESTM
jgi:hypothetical protein